MAMSANHPAKVATDVIACMYYVVPNYLSPTFECRMKLATLSLVRTMHTHNNVNLGKDELINAATTAYAMHANAPFIRLLACLLVRSVYPLVHCQKQI